jgi:major vault protein
MIRKQEMNIFSKVNITVIFFNFKGPGTYIPRVEVQVVEIVKAVIVKPNQALRLKARRECVDSKGSKRYAGEEWLIRDTGAYLPDVDEEVRETVSAFILTDKKSPST